MGWEASLGETVRLNCFREAKETSGWETELGTVRVEIGMRRNSSSLNMYLLSAFLSYELTPLMSPEFVMTLVHVCWVSGNIGVSKSK